MPLPTLHWKYVGQVTNSGSLRDIGAAMNTIWTLVSKATYADGSARVPGTGSAWTWSQDQTAGTTTGVYGQAPTVTSMNMWYMLGGSASATYTAAAPDGRVSNVVVAGMCRNATGGYLGWQSNPSFTGGTNSGFWRASAIVAASGGVDFNWAALWESEEACMFQFFNGSGNRIRYAAFGALFDPLVYVPGVTCEADGRAYFLCVNPQDSNVYWLEQEDDPQTMIGGGSGGNNEAKTGRFSTSGLSASGRRGARWPATSSLGSTVCIPFATNIGGLAGVSRQFGVTASGYTLGTRTNSSGDVVGYVFSCSTGNIAGIVPQAILLLK